MSNVSDYIMIMLSIRKRTCLNCKEDTVEMSIVVLSQVS